jgi:hypothetical protein
MFKISVKNCHLRSGYTVRPVWGWNLKEYEELLDCSRNLQHRVCAPVVGPQCSLEISFTICLCLRKYKSTCVRSSDFASQLRISPQTRRIHRLGYRQSRTCVVQGAHRTGRALMVEYPTACMERNDMEAVHFAKRQRKFHVSARPRKCSVRPADI